MLFNSNQVKQVRCTKCGSYECVRLAARIGNLIKGVGMVLYNQYNNRKTGAKTDTVLVVKENGYHAYPNTFNVPGGKMEQDCVVMCAMRELHEETGIKLGINEFLSLATDKNGNIRFFMHVNTPLIVLNTTKKGFSRGTVNQMIKDNNNNPNLGKSFKETVCVEWLKLGSQKNCTAETIDGKTVPISLYLEAVMRKTDVNKL